ncbi:uncharacterized protein PAE49_012765 [Odontesthes bonariensis]|uniref:uncharacterized protein LOC142391748 n=1 Tax=Odontesthes bonariensis TaxID=219752 RepID=UPI003F586034
MDTWKHICAVLLSIFCTFNTAVYQKPLVKTIGKEPDVTPICSNETGNFITVLVCRIRTGMNRSEECLLAYRHLRGFEHGCDSRFTLVTINQTVFLHLDNLTPEDSGTYTCQCARPDGTFTLHLNITVKENENLKTNIPTQPPYSNAVVGLTVLIIMIITAVVLGVIYRHIYHRRRKLSITTPANTEVTDNEVNSVYLQKENELYLTSAIHK